MVIHGGGGVLVRDEREASARDDGFRAKWHKPKCLRIFLTIFSSSINAITLIEPWNLTQVNGSTLPNFSEIPSDSAPASKHRVFDDLPESFFDAPTYVTVVSIVANHLFAFGRYMRVHSC